MTEELRAVIDLELRLLDLDVRRSRELAGPLIDPEFREYGASGREWDRDSVLDVVFASDIEPLVVSDEAAVRLADDVVLVTYRTRRRDRTTLRSSIWRREPGGPWRVLFHQGTPVPTEVCDAASDRPEAADTPVHAPSRADAGPREAPGPDVGKDRGDKKEPKDDKPGRDEGPGKDR